MRLESTGCHGGAEVNGMTSALCAFEGGAAEDGGSGAWAQDRRSLL